MSSPAPVHASMLIGGQPVNSNKLIEVFNPARPGELVGTVPRGTPDDVARAVLFFLDRDAGYVTGQALFVCGGTSVTGTGGA